MSMLNSTDRSPDTPVIEAAAERLALKEMDLQKFDGTKEMSGFQRGYMFGFAEGAEFMRTFYRKRDILDRLDRVERERKRCEPEKNDHPDYVKLLRPAEQREGMSGTTAEQISGNDPETAVSSEPKAEIQEYPIDDISAKYQDFFENTLGGKAHD